MHYISLTDNFSPKLFNIIKFLKIPTKANNLEKKINLNKTTNKLLAKIQIILMTYYINSKHKKNNQP